MRFIPPFAAVGLAALTSVICVTRAASHPHVFVDTDLAVEVDEDGLVHAVMVTWTYDAFETLLVLDEWGMVAAYDTGLSVADAEALTGYDLLRFEGVGGDLYLARATSEGETAIALNAPEGRGVSLTDGRLTTTHRRALVTPTPAAGVVIRSYDPTFYTNYTLYQIAPVPGCIAEVTPPNLDAAYSLVDELLYAMPQPEAEENYPKVGKAFSDTLRLRCGGA